MPAPHVLLVLEEEVLGGPALATEYVPGSVPMG